MPRLATILTDKEVPAISKRGFTAVGGVPGLGLSIAKSGTRSWVLRVPIGGRVRDMGLGPAPSQADSAEAKKHKVALSDARSRALDARRLIQQGIDPISQSHAKRNELKNAEAARKAIEAARITFKEAATKYVSSRESGWKNAKHVQQWTRSLELYAYPVMGDLQVDQIKLPQVLKVLEPIWEEKNETASRVRGRIEAVLDWATVREHREGPNPARWRGHLDKVLGAPSKVAPSKSHAALPYREMSSFMARLRDVGGQGARALECAILTASRSGEVRGMRWSEIDLETGIWIIPKERMKAGREHRVPLSKAVMVLLENAPRMAGTDLVFPAPRGGELSDMTLSAVLRRMSVPAVPHGFRSTFKDWCTEQTAYANEVSEMALAHTIANKTEAAYRRGYIMDKRRRLAEDWAKFCNRPSQRGGEVVAIRGRA